MSNYNEAVEIIRQEAIFDSSDKKRVNFMRQLAEADAEYYSVHALKSELKKKLQLHLPRRQNRAFFIRH
jgi:hypothetical protein